MTLEIPSIGKCRVCADADVTYLCDTHNTNSYTTSLSHYKCALCGSVFIGNNVSSEELSIAYSSLNTTSYYEEIARENTNKMNAAADYLKTAIRHNASILDIGTGNGLFIEILTRSGFDNVSAHEIQGSDLSRLSSIANRIYQDCDYSTIPSDTFDAVTLLDVVEHVIDPQSLIETCGRILKDDGLIYLHTPVVTNTDRFMHCLLRIPVLKRVGAIWQNGRTSIFHLENYTPMSLKLILTRAGFNGLNIKVKNELSWPVARYVRTYLLGRYRLPKWMAPFLALLFYPLLATDTFNANKAIVSARKARGAGTRG